MRLPRVRFTVRRMMVAVAVVAVILAAEPYLFGYAVGVVGEPGEDGTHHYIRGEAIFVWVILNIAIFTIVLISSKKNCVI